MAFDRRGENRMRQSARLLMLTGGVVLSFFAQQPAGSKPLVPAVRAQSSSTVSVSGTGPETTVEIHNVSYEVTADFVPNRPHGERLLLRKSISSKQILGDMGQEASTTLEAWPMGVDLKERPIYTLKVSGVGGQTVESALFVAERGLEEVNWWSVYRLGTGKHLFDTYVPLVSFSISNEMMEMRYVGLEIPPDDTADARLKRPNVVAVVTYASQAGVKREALLTCDDPKQAQLLRSYADTSRTVSASEGRPARAVKISFQVYDQTPPPPVNLTIPLAGDDLDLAHAQLPPKLHLAAWRR